MFAFLVHIPGEATDFMNAGLTLHCTNARNCEHEPTAQLKRNRCVTCHGNFRGSGDCSQLENYRYKPIASSYHQDFSFHPWHHGGTLEVGNNMCNNMCDSIKA